MSSAPRTPGEPAEGAAPPTRDSRGTKPGGRVTLSVLAERKTLGEPIVMVTAYDFPSAQVAEAAGVDVVLVGDTAAASATCALGKS